jgi:ribonuclease BN (tRNA processing enzyme)
VKLTVIGCSPAWPNPGSAHSGYLLEAGDNRLMLDCGPGVLSRLLVNEAWPRIDAIVLSHLHLDHAGDLVAWLWGSLSGPGRGLARPELWLPAGGRGELDRLASLDTLARVFPMHEYDEGEAFAVAGFELSARRVPHYGHNAFALRVERDGVVLAYSGDSAFSEVLVDVARNADLFLCEATLAEPELHEPVGHMTADDALELARRANARRLVLTHRSADRPVPAGAEGAYDGLVVDVGGHKGAVPG